MANFFVSWLPGKVRLNRKPYSQLESPLPSAALPASSRHAPQGSRLGWTIGVGVLALHLTNPLCWGLTYPGVWFPPAAIGILLAAWVGRSAGIVIALDAILVAVQAAFLGYELPWGQGWVGWLGACLDAPLSGIEALVAWHLYYTMARCSRRPTEPVAASFFLFVIPGLVTGAFAFLHATLSPGPADFSFSAWLGALWLSRALAILAIVPVALVNLTLWILRQGLAIPEVTDSDRHHDVPVRLTAGDVVELLGLVCGTALLAGLLALSARQANGAGWQLWMLTLLLIIWASLRQGLRGATIAAASAAVAALLPAVLDGGGASWAFPVQGYVLAFCTTGLLVGVSSDWMQLTEFRGRLLVGHVPIVIYSARFYSKKGHVPSVEQIEVTYLNAATLSVLKRQRDQLLGCYSKWLLQVHPQDREVLQAALTQLTTHEQSVTVEYRLAAAGEEEVPNSETAPPTSISTHDLPLASERPAKLTWVRDTLVPTFDANRNLVGWEGVVLEITEQRLLADDLRRTTKMFHSLVTNLPAGVFFVHAPSGRPILVNARARELLGQPADLSAKLPQWSEVYRLHRPDGSLYPTEDLPVSVSLRNGVTHMRDDIVVHRRDGRKIPLITWAAPLDLRGRGAPDAAVWVLEDMTALRKAEAAHRESEARLRTLIETMAEGLVVCDRNGVIVESNPAAALLLGVEAESLIGQSVASKIWSYLREDGSSLPIEEHPVFRTLQTGQPGQDEVIGLIVSGGKFRPARQDLSSGSANGCLEETPWGNEFFPLENDHAHGVRWLLLSTRPLLRGNDPRTLRIVTTFTDITALRCAANVVRASESRYRGLIESMPLMLLQSDQGGRITYINPALHELTDYDLEDLKQPEGWRVLVVAEDQARWQSAQAEALLQGRESRLELHLKARDGGERTCLVLVQPRRSHEQIVGLNTLILDMTMQRQLERKLQRSQRMELAGRLASGLAHDFNNQLTVILNLVALVQSQLGRDHMVQPDLENITEAGEQAARLAGQLLTFSKQRQLNTKRLDLGVSTGRILALVRATLPKAIELDFVCDEDGMHVEADETQIQQLLMNLMLNARDAMPSGGRLSVRLAADSQSDAGEGDKTSWVHLSIEDTGHGMTEHTRAHIFDPFFTTKANGTGLGLAVVQQIVESSGGRLGVTSELGKGTCFDIWLPSAGACKAI